MSNSGQVQVFDEDIPEVALVDAGEVAGDVADIGEHEAVHALDHSLEAQLEARLGDGADEGLEARVGVRQLHGRAAAEETQGQHAGGVNHLHRSPDRIGGDGAPIRVPLLPACRHGAQGLAHELSTLIEDLVSRHAGLLVSVSWRYALRGAASRKP